jgi:hypothetical protein
VRRRAKRVHRSHDDVINRGRRNRGTLPGLPIRAAPSCRVQPSNPARQPPGTMPRGSHGVRVKIAAFARRLGRRAGRGPSFALFVLACCHFLLRFRSMGVASCFSCA